MNILLAFKAEPDAGMLAEKEWQAAAQGKSGPDISLLRSLLGADEQAAAALEGIDLTGCSSGAMAVMNIIRNIDAYKVTGGDKPVMGQVRFQNQTR